MPKMDGFAVMENLKTIETSGYLPVLVITAQPEHKLRALRAGARDFVSKPFDLAEVLLRVHNLLEVRLLHSETLELYDRVVAEKQISDHLLQELVRHGLEPGPAIEPRAVAAPMAGSRAEVAVIFLDLATFTTFSEGADAEVLKGVLDAISRRAEGAGPDRTRILRQAYLGTAGLPDALANPTIASTERALDLLEAVDRFNSHNPFKLKIHLTVEAPADGEKRAADASR
jgi:adenylate cyclase